MNWGALRDHKDFEVIRGVIKVKSAIEKRELVAY